ncbi:hypothetical protein LJB81_00870 [Desulfovibrio sp. OttesenSCG-928-M14]|nr:hypothetical protein [Desulfovibrio sp. OttesenSCG-928-M14]
MNYPNELCQLVIRNMEIIETAPQVVEAVEKRLFAAMNDRVKTAVKAKKNWEGCFDLVTDKDDETTVFGPETWLSGDDDSFGAYYEMSYVEDIATWLSCAIGAVGASLCLEFAVDTDWSGQTVREYKKALENFYAGNTALQKAGFSLAADKKSIIKTFHFDAEKLAGEYPDFDEALAPLDEALQDLFKVHAEFDKFVTGLSKKRG